MKLRKSPTWAYVIYLRLLRHTTARCDVRLPKVHLGGLGRDPWTLPQARSLGPWRIQAPASSAMRHSYALFNSKTRVRRELKCFNKHRDMGSSSPRSSMTGEPAPSIAAPAAVRQSVTRPLVRPVRELRSAEVLLSPSASET